MPESRYQGVIFDLDGLMLDSERLALEAWKKAGRERGYTVTDAHYFQITGRRVVDAEKIFKGIFGPDFPFREIQQRRVDLVQQILADKGIPVKPGLMSLLDKLEERGIPKAVGTSTIREQAMAKLVAAKLDRRFRAIVTGDQVRNGKPNPDIFLLAAEKLELDPAVCIVFEDSEAGIMAAHTAGMLPIMVPDIKPPGEAVKQIAYRVLNSLDEAPEVLFTSELLGNSGS